MINNSTKTDNFLLLNGVRQGAILSPLLFNFYINSIIQRLKKFKLGCRINYEMCNAMAYADDIILLAPTHSAAQSMLNIISGDLNTVDLLLNIKKCKSLIFSRHKKALEYPPLKVNGEHIEYVKTFKYLGITLNGSLTNKDDLLRAEKAHLKQFFPVLKNMKITIMKLKFFCIKLIVIICME